MAAEPVPSVAAMSVAWPALSVAPVSVSCPGVDGDAQEAPAEQVPVFTQWQDTSGVHVDTRLSWHACLPVALPEDPEESICFVRLLAPGSPAEFFEARLQRHHLTGHAGAWTQPELERLMATMAQPGGRESENDTVLLRRQTGRMVVDVLFRYPGAVERRVVEILNAYPTGASLRTDATCLLRSVALAQRTHRKSIAEAQSRLESTRKSIAELEDKYVEECARAKKTCRDRMWRFVLLLNAKIEKERSLHATAEELRREALNRSAPMTAATNPVATGPLGAARCESRGRGGRGGRRGRSNGMELGSVKRPRVDPSSSPERGGPGSVCNMLEPAHAAGEAVLSAPQPPRQTHTLTEIATFCLLEPLSDDEARGGITATASQPPGPTGNAVRPAVPPASVPRGTKAIADSLFHSDSDG